MHNYQDNISIAILKRIAEALGLKSRLWIGEITVPAKTEVGGGFWYILDVFAHAYYWVIVHYGGKIKEAIIMD